MSSQSSPIVEAPQPQVERHIMRRDEVERKTGFKRAHIYNLMKEGIPLKNNLRDRASQRLIGLLAVVLFAGGTLLRRAKRARPETWLYRKLEWILASRWRLGRGGLILHSGAWTVRRSRRLRPALSRWQP